MKQYSYQSYDEYVHEQTEANKRKIHSHWVQQRVIKWIAARYPATSILCHGTRNATEQRWFQQYYPTATVLGTEISETATRFPMTVQWDFAHPRDEWIGQWDIVYSNAFDHSRDPLATLRTWIPQVRPGGRLFVEISVSPYELIATAIDPFVCTHDEFSDIVHQAGGCIKRVIHTPRGRITPPDGGPRYIPDTRMYAIVSRG